jgi:hypothetical protein
MLVVSCIVSSAAQHMRQGNETDTSRIQQHSAMSSMIPRMCIQGMLLSASLRLFER